MDLMVLSHRLEWLVFLSYILGIFIHGSYGYYNQGWKSSVKSASLMKVQLTQKGYIQFLRYVEAVPPITEYTFCIWMKSYDLSHSHPLLSYSRNDRERLIRVWISPRGKSINLELQGVLVVEITFEFKEHKWYHVCQSWDSATATWELFVNDKKLRGRAPKLTGLVLRGGGDIVVAQEYTDFDKGLEDGVEGEIFGFNLVLSSTSKIQKHPRYPASPPNNVFDDYKRRLSYVERQSKYRPLYTPNSNAIFQTFQSFTNFPLWWENPYPSSPNSFHLNNLWPEKTPRSPASINPAKIVRINPSNELFAFPAILKEDAGFGNENGKSTGLKLVEMSKNCRIGRGAPIRGEKVLINWTDTMVRVFGGAIMKQVQPFC